MKRRRYEKPLIYVFCEGESEEAYIKSLKDLYGSVVSIKKPFVGVDPFALAVETFKKNNGVRENVEIINEVWFFFDVEKDDQATWDKKIRYLKELEKQRKKPKIKIRLLMTTACVEYWFLLHYKKCSPPLKTKPDKERIQHELEIKVPDYKKGDKSSTDKIATELNMAIENGKWTLNKLKTLGLPSLDESPERNKWLFQCQYTYTTVHEAIMFLEELLKAKTLQ